LPLFASTAKSNEELLQRAAICPAAASEVLHQHASRFGEADLKYLTNLIAIDSVAPCADFRKVPTTVCELTVFLRARAEDWFKQKVWVNGLGVVLHEVWCLAKWCPGLEVSALIECAKVLMSLIAFDVGNETTRFQWCESLSAHFFAIALEVGQAIVRSPTYPHLRVTRSIDFLLRAAFDDLVAASIQKPRALLTYLLNGEPDTSSVMCLLSGSESLYAEGLQRIAGYIITNLGPFVRFGLELLKASTLIG
jgi:hypothetical protein